MSLVFFADHGIRQPYIQLAAAMTGQSLPALSSPLIEAGMTGRVVARDLT